MAACPVPHRNFRESPMTEEETRAVNEWYDREIRAGVEARRQPQPCSVPGCGQVGRLYACGYRCPDHAP
jgi:hypothetical protein